MQEPLDLETAHAPRRRGWRRLRRAAGASAVCLVAFGAAAHLPIVRAWVLARATSWADVRFGLRTAVGTLDYNLFTLRFTLTRVSIAAGHAVDRPFFTADRIDVDFPWTSLAGARRLQALRIDRPRISVVVDAADRVNLPIITRGATGGSPLAVDALVMRDVSVSIDDRVRQVTLDLQQAGLRITGDAGGLRGGVRMRAPGALQVDGWTTTLTGLDGRFAVERGALRLDPLTVGTSEGELSVRGTVGFAADAPIDLTLGARVHADRLAPGLWQGAVARGTLEVSGHATGTVAQPVASLAVRGASVAWNSLAPATIRSELVVSRHELEVRSLAVTAPWGRVQAVGRIADANAAAPSRLRVTWTGIEADAVTGALDLSLPLRFGSSTNGNATLEWRSGSAGSLSVDAVTSATPGRGTALPVGGTARLVVSRGRWTVRHDLRAPGGLAAKGTIEGTPAGSGVGLSGTAEASVADAAAALRAVSVAGLDLPSAVTDAVAASASARLAWSGTTAAPRLDVTLASDDFRYAPWPAARLEASLSVAGRQVSIRTAAARMASGTLTARGLVIDTKSTLLLGRIDADLQDVGPALHGLAPALGPVGGRAKVSAELGGSLARPRLDAMLDASDLSAAGQHLDHVEGQVVFSSPRIEWEGVRALQGEGMLETRGGLDLVRRSFEVSARGNGLQVGPCPRGQVPCPDGLPVAAVVEALTVTITGTVERPSGSADIRVRDAQWQEHRIGQASGRAAFADGRSTVDLHLPDQGLSLSGDVALARPRTFRATVTAARTPVARVLEIAGRTAIARRVTGELSGAGTIAGDLDRLDLVAIQATLPPSSLEIDGRTWRTGRPALVAYGPDRLAVDDLQVLVGNTTVSVSGGLDRDGASRLRVAVDAGLGDVAPTVLASLPGATLEGRARASFEVSGAPRSPRVAGTLDLEQASFASPTAAVSVERLHATFGNGSIEVTDAALASKGVHAVGSARVPASFLADVLPRQVLDTIGASAPGDRARLTAEIRASLSDTPIAPGPQLPMSGTIRARVEADAERPALAAVRGAVSIDVAEITVGTSRIAQASAGRLSIADGRITLEPWHLAGSGTDLTASATVTVRADGTLPIDVHLSGPIVLEPLQALIGIPVSGRLVTELSVGGTLTDPRASGTAIVSDGALRIRSPRIALASLEGTVRIAGNVATTDGLHGLVNGAPFTLSGDLAVPGTATAQAPRVLRLRAQRVPVQPFASGPRAEAGISVTFTDAGAERTIAGRVNLLPQPFRGSILAIKQLVDEMSASQPAGATRRRPRPGVNPVRLDVAIVSREPLLLDTNAGRVELVADLKLAGTVVQPSLLGRINALEDGVLRAGGRTYTISSATIDFTNPRRMTPVINAAATTRISTYAITMIVAGTPDALRTSLSSDPPLAESDLRSLIVTGRLPSESTAHTTGSVSERKVVESISGDVFGFAAQAIGLDAVSIGTPELDLLSGDIDARTSLNITKSFSRKIEVLFSRDLQDDRSSWLVIYRPTRAISFRFLSRDTREGALEFRQEFRFGGPPPAAAAAARTPPRRARNTRITHVTFTGERGVPDAQLQKALRLAPGDRFDTWTWRGETDRLVRLYRDRGYYTARVLPQRRGGTDGVALEYAITRGPRTTLAVDGHQMPPAAIERMRDAWAESVSTSFLVEDLERIARAHLVDDGYLQASVTAEIPVQTPEAMAVLLRVRAGTPVESREIEFTGQSAEMAGRVKAFLETSGLDTTAWYGPSALKAPLETFYRDRGYLDAQVTPGDIRVEGSVARLTVAVAEGRLYRVNTITVENADVLGTERVRAATGVAPGTPWKTAYLDSARTGVESAYGAAGFADTEVYVEPQIDATAATVTLYVAVAEGQRRVLQDLSIAGNASTSSKTISDLVRLRFGDPVTPTLVSDVQKRLYDVGVFSRVTVDFTPGTPATAVDAYDDPVIAKVTVVEAPRYSVQYGVQVSRTLDATSTEAEYKPGGAVEFKDRNFLGRAFGLGVGARIDARTQSGRATVTVPRTYGTSIRSYLFLDHTLESSTPEPGFIVDDNTSSATVEQRWRARPGVELSWGLAYDYRRATLSAVREKTLELLTYSGDTVGPRLAFVHDSRDDPFDAKRGFFHSSGLDFGIAPLGSDLGYTRYLLQTYVFLPKGPLVSASALRYGGLSTYGPENLIALDLLFKAGGSRSVRGYAEDSLSAVNFLNVPLGGRQLLVLNQELRFPVWWWFKGAGFVDAGNTFVDASHVRLSGLKVGAGWGLRLASPFALIRFDVGYPVNNGSDHRARYYLSIGQAF